MVINGTITPADFEMALKRARELGVVRATPGLAAPLDAGLRGRIADVWDQIEEAFREAWRSGYAATRDAIDRAAAEAEKLIAASGKMAHDVHQAILARLQEYLSVLIDAVLAQVRSTITVGESTLGLRRVDMARRIGLAGSLKATLTGVAELIGSGEITVTASYGASD
jgi:hypothetical protein